ncbi:MAG TPA: Flp pilus assembly protein CpaB [Terriglobales bacterium]
MNRNRLLLIGLMALAVGALTSMVVYKNLRAKAAGASVPGEDVIVAAEDLQVGEKIEDKDLKVVHFPAADLPSGRFHMKSKLIGRGVVLPIAKGEFILTSKVAGENAGAGLPALIPPGMRAISVRVNDTSSVAGFVLPGTRVDVLLTGNPEGSNEPQTTTVLENVAVIANGSKLERNANGEPQLAPVITLLVSPEDAERLALASTQGHIQLALRNPTDTKQADVGAVKSRALYGVAAPAEPVEAAKPKVKHSAPAPVPTLPNTFTVEVYKGDKKEETKF